MSTLSDARVVRTRDALREAMTALAAERALDAITVRAIAARAGVGYATFFRHYSDKEALLADVAGRLIQDFLRQVRPLLQQSDRRAAARSMCAFVHDRLPLYKALLAGGSGETVRAEMLRATMDTMAMARTRPAEGPLDDLMLFHLVSATLNLLSWWLRHLDEVDIDTMAEMIDRAVLTPVSALRTRPPEGC
ncbi:TetR/AcrR family transcriptional regulator [Phenylobacterium sp.]|uniref:TetR/AcrR family transcriptional regulator n=1 Tax=Phenylobacterium sp. TaxID=1871053 RepID=UPI003567F9ED